MDANDLIMARAKRKQNDLPEGLSSDEDDSTHGKSNNPLVNIEV